MSFPITRPTTFALGAALLAVLADSAPAQDLTRISLDSVGNAADGFASLPEISASGRYVSFVSEADDMVGDDIGPQERDVFLFDVLTGLTYHVSRNTADAAANADSSVGSVADDGRVAFTTSATNIDPADLDAHTDVFVRDPFAGTTETASVDGSGQHLGGAAQGEVSMSSSGDVVAWATVEALSPADTNGLYDIYVRDTDSGTTQLASVSTAGVLADAACGLPRISGNGRFVVFQSEATTLVLDDTNGERDIFVRDLLFGTTERVSVGPGGEADDFSRRPDISDNGRYVTFYTQASNLVPALPQPDGDTSLSDKIVRHDRETGSNAWVSVGSGDRPAADGSIGNARISGNGRYVAFVARDVDWFNNGGEDDHIYVRDMQAGTTTLCDVIAPGFPGNGEADEPVLSGSGALLVFSGGASDLTPGDDNDTWDIFVGSSAPDTTWLHIDAGLPGTSEPLLNTRGRLSSGAPLRFDVERAEKNALSFFVLGASRIDAPFKGGTLVPNPDFFVTLPTGSSGGWQLDLFAPAGVPAGAELFFQVAVQDPDAPAGMALSNGVRGTFE
jgi:hypothetical protein